MNMERRRPITRNSHMYIDVLHIPKISDAVHHASTMLREGILKAMSSNVQVLQPQHSNENAASARNISSAQPNSTQPTGSSSSGLTDIQSSSTTSDPNSNANTNTKKAINNQDSNQQPTSSLVDSKANDTFLPSATNGRDPLSVYSAAVAKRPRKQSLSAASAPDPSQQRDSMSVYTAVTMGARKSSKPVQNSTERPSEVNNQSAVSNELNTGTQDNPKPNSIAKTANVSSISPVPSPFFGPQNPGLRAWNRDKKAGPSILSKRSRPEATTTSVSQPSPKRERRDLSQTSKDSPVTTDTDPANSLPTSNGAKSPEQQASALNKSEQQSKDEKGNTSSSTANMESAEMTTGQTQQQQQQHTPTVQLVAIPGSAAKLKENGPPVQREMKEKERQRLIQQKEDMRSKKKVVYKDTETGDKDTIDTDEGAAAAMAAAGVSKFKSKRSMKGTTLSMTTALLGSGHQQTQTMALLRKKMGGAPSSATNGRVSRDVSVTNKLTGSQITQAQKETLLRRGGVTGGNLTLRNGIVMNNTRPSDSSTTTTVTPSGTIVAKDIKFVPGLLPINDVQPNGYTVSDRGEVKPVVTFTATLKVPYKLRQNVLEKMFAAWKDERKVGEANALQKSLRTEQEVYSQSAGRVEYRAAMLEKMKDIRSGSDD